MMTRILLVACFFVPYISFAQEAESQEKTKRVQTIMSAGEKRAKITAQGGYYVAYDYNDVVPGENFSLDFSYMLNGMVSIGQHMNFGRTRYFENERSNFAEYNVKSDGTNADILVIQAGLTLGFTYPLSKFIGFSAQTGVVTYSETIMYPAIGNTALGEELWLGYKQETRTIFTAPLIVSMQYIASDIFEIGFRGGFYISPGESLIGKHFGPHAVFKF